jgi:hypothetical protein
MMPKILIPVVCALLTAACTGVPVKDEESPLSRIVPGSRIVLHEALTVPAGHARVFLQDGKVRAKTRLRRYYPHCNFEIEQVSDGTLQIIPDTFTVTAIRSDEVEFVSRPRRGPIVPAALTLANGDGDAVILLNRLVEHRLHSAAQPQVMRLTCYSGFDEGWSVAYPSVRQIRQTLGEIATVELPGNAD